MQKYVFVHLHLQDRSNIIGVKESGRKAVFGYDRENKTAYGIDVTRRIVC